MADKTLTVTGPERDVERLRRLARSRFRRVTFSAVAPARSTAPKRKPSPRST